MYHVIFLGYFINVKTIKINFRLQINYNIFITVIIQSFLFENHFSRWEKTFDTSKTNFNEMEWFTSIMFD